MATNTIGIHELAEQLGVSAQTIYRWRSIGANDNMPPGFKVGQAVRWRQEAVDQWIAAQEAKEA